MRLRWWPSLRRLIAALLLSAGAAPSAFELIRHGSDDGPTALHHVESSTFRHHADQCLGAATVSDGSAPVIHVPTLAVRSEFALAPVETGTCNLARVYRGRPTSRGPPPLLV